jgi:SAM-dependent methyltransferase
MDLQQTKSDWTALGTKDPLWAVLTAPDRRHGKWDAETFLATGRSEVREALARLPALGLHPGRERALDFGCGAGRLTLALADEVDEVVGVDISAPMLATAREFERAHPHRARCTFVESDAPDLGRFPDADFDIVFSSLVLQHLPPPVARGYLAEMIRVLRPGGAVIVQLVTGPDASVKGLLTRVLPLGAIRFAQRRLLRYPAPMDMHPMGRIEVEAVAAQSGGRLVDAVDEPMYGGNWHYTRYYVTR